MYHSRGQHTWETPGLQTGARREADAPHGALTCLIDRHKDAGRVFFLVQERLLQVEKQAEGEYRLTFT